jgi:hypothetical protein
MLDQHAGCICCDCLMVWSWLLWVSGFLKRLNFSRSHYFQKAHHCVGHCWPSKNFLKGFFCEGWLRERHSKTEKDLNWTFEDHKWNNILPPSVIIMEIFSTNSTFHCWINTVLGFKFFKMFTFLSSFSQFYRNSGSTISIKFTYSQQLTSTLKSTNNFHF